MSWLSSRQRVLLGILLISLSWLIVDDWRPQYTAELVIKRMSVGDSTNALFPLIPWFGFYLASTALGEHLEPLFSGRLYDRVALSMLRIGASLMTGGFALRGLRWSATHGLIPGVQETSDLLALTTTWQKYPPGPTYLLFYSGAGLILIAGVAEIWRRAIARRLLGVLSAVGQASFFVFAVQAQLYFVALYYFHLPRVRAWPLLFAATLAPLVLAGWWWARHRMNRHLTVGLPTLVAAIVERRQTVIRTGA
jgi:hypothetical protein